MGKEIEDKELAEFTRRLTHALDESDEFKERRGRQGKLAKLFGITPGATRKWLVGESYPGRKRTTILAQRLKVRVDWLLEGQGPMRLAQVIPAESSEINVMLLEQVLEESDQELKKAELESLSYSLRAKLYVYIYEDARKEGRVDREKIVSLIRMLASCRSPD